MSDVRTTLRAVVALGVMPGGCDDCDAEQTMTEVVPGMFRLTVGHDDTCPWFRAWNEGAPPDLR